MNIVSSVMEWCYKVGVFSVFGVILIQALVYLKNSYKLKKKKLPPGPRGLPVIGNALALGERPHESLAELAKTHGPLMTIKLGFKTIVVATSVELAEEILVKQDEAFLGRPALDAITAQRDYQRSLATMSAGPKWKTLRKMMTTHVFTSQCLDALQELRHQMVDNMVNSLVEASHLNECVNIGSLVFRTAFNLMANMIFSVDLIDPQSNYVLEHQHIRNIQKLLLKPNLSDAFPFLRPFDLQGIKRELKISFDRFQGLIDGLIEQRMQQRRSGSPRRDDLLDIFLDQCKESSANFEDFTIEDVNVLILDLFFGASASTATTIEWLITELLRNPHVMANARQELKETIGSSSRRVDEKVIPKLTYLQAVINETMRLHTVSVIVHKTLVDVEIGGYSLPKNTEVMVNGWALARDPKYWDRADEFLPERFLEKLGHGSYFIPFGAGRRMCPGMPLARRILDLVIATLIHRFHWELPQGMSPQDLDMTHSFGFTLQKVIPLLACPRKIKTAYVH